MQGRKVNVVIVAPGLMRMPIHEAARREGVLLCSALAKSFRLWVTKALLEPLWDRMAATKTLVICYSQSFANYFTLLCYAVGLR